MPGEELIYLELGDRRLVISHGERTVGRSHRCDVVVDDRSVSRVHAMVSWSSGRLTVQDLNSSNGTYVNAELLRGEADLCDGDELRLGEAKLRVRRIPGTQSEPIPVDELTAAVDERFTEYRSDRPPADRFRTSAGADEISADWVVEAKTALVDPGSVDPALVADSISEMRTGLFPAPDAQRPSSDWQDYGTRGGVETAEVEALPTTVTQEETESELLPSIDFSEPLSFDESTPGPSPSPSLESASPPAATPLAVPLPRPRSRLSPAVDLGPRLAAGLFDFVFLTVLALTSSYLRGGMATAEGRSLALSFAIGFGTLALVGSWVFWGATPGQRMVGLQVCDELGRSPLTLSRALRRLVGFVLSIATLGLGFVSLVFHREKLALHDLISATRVVRKP